MRPFAALDAVQKRETFRADFGIGKNILDGGEFGLGQEERVGQPVEQTFVKQFLRANIRAEDPECFRNPGGDCGDEESVRGFRYVGEGDRADAVLDIVQLLRDRFSSGYNGG